MRLINADELLEKMYRYNDNEGARMPYGDDDSLIHKDSACFLIENAPTIEPERKKGKWIPCEERLPEDDTLMLVNYIDERPDAMDIWIGWHEMENVWYIDGEEHSREHGNEVIAWMPLPEPYREESR